MNKKNKIRFLIIIVNGFFLFMDRYLKHVALEKYTQPKLINEYLGWKPFINQGAAFSLPIPNLVIIFLTIPIIFLIFYLLLQKDNSYNFAAWILVTTGAISNLIDRIYYNYVIDYLVFVTSIINIADILIVTGLSMYLIKNFKSK